jgi:hypothetical protein
LGHPKWVNPLNGHRFFAKTLKFVNANRGRMECVSMISGFWLHATKAGEEVMRRFLGALALVAVALFGFGAPQAEAMVQYVLSVPNTAVAPYPGPYGTVDVELLSGTTAKVTLTALSNGSIDYLFLGESALALNTGGAASYVDGSFVGTSPTGGNPMGNGFTDPEFVSATSGNISEFGDFDVSI